MMRRRFGSVVKRGATYSVRWRLHGKAFQKVVGPDRKVALGVLADLEAKLAREESLGVREIAKAPIREVWEAVRGARKSRLSERALETAEQHIREAERFFGSKPVADLTPANLSDFFADLAARSRKPSTLARYMVTLSALWTEAVARGFAAENIVRAVKRFKVEERERPFLGEADLLRLMAAAPAGLREVIAILADSALRRGELLSLCWSDVNLARGAVLVRRAKGGKGREVPLTTRAREAFASLRAARGAIPMTGEDPVFADLLTRGRRDAKRPEGALPLSDRRRAETRLSKRFSRLAKRAGLPGTRLHDLRHSAASRMVMAGVPLSAVARVTGHSTLRCAALYGRHAPQDAAKMAIRALEEASATAAPSVSPNPTAAPVAAIAL